MPDVVVGAGHNGLVAACYLARAGRDVLVLEALDGPGGGSRTAETIPGFRFDLHSVAHNMINMTSIPEELDLARVGLVYQEMDPFTVVIHEDGRRVRFHRSVDATVESIAEVSSDEALAYSRFIDKAMPIPSHASARRSSHPNRRPVRVGCRHEPFRRHPGNAGTNGRPRAAARSPASVAVARQKSEGRLPEHIEGQGSG